VRVCGEWVGVFKKSHPTQLGNLHAPCTNLVPALAYLDGDEFSRLEHNHTHCSKNPGHCRERWEAADGDE
jgi:hypothetical protein